MSFISLLLLISTTTRAQEFYKKGEFSKALDKYCECKESGVSNPGLYFNIGNCYYRLGKYGKALLNYRRAWFLAPDNRDIRHNINMFTGSGVSPNPFVSWLSGIIDRIPLRTFTWVLVISAGLLLIFISLRLLQRVREFNFPSTLFIFLSGIVFIFSVIGFSVWMGRVNSDWVVFTDPTTAYSGPGKQFKELMRVNETEEGSVLRESEGWWLVHLHSGEGGWVDSTTCARVIIPEMK